MQTRGAWHLATPETGVWDDGQVLWQSIRVGAAGSPVCSRDLKVLDDVTHYAPNFRQSTNDPEEEQFGYWLMRGPFNLTGQSIAEAGGFPKEVPSCLARWSHGIGDATNGD
ncbi:uncharacterized protein CLUP02_15564 [Colletotrichum lupini]|uniref:Uncharacterized protein n=1 Tax=Colletotrichum lupini TaxID=145971 RepID=A0A9Q8T6Y1_9PEZI|nr:uncharacterized protein CLUP02_15564 [Colletotrichum lupini]UQC90033.1 hypothetical protein CLUP02_15564 [Colletotrichum lupini]